MDQICMKQECMTYKDILDVIKETKERHPECAKIITRIQNIEDLKASVILFFYDDVGITPYAHEVENAINQMIKDGSIANENQTAVLYDDCAIKYRIYCSQETLIIRDSFWKTDGDKSLRKQHTILKLDLFGEKIEMGE